MTSRAIRYGWPIGAGGYVAPDTSTGQPTQDNILAGDVSYLSGNLAWASRFQLLEQRFTALGAS